MSLVTCSTRISIFNLRSTLLLLPTRTNFNIKIGTNREARFMKKLMVGTSKSRRKWYTEDQAPSKVFKDFNFLQGNVVSAEKRQKSGRVNRRVNVLNTVFMEQITSLLATGDAGVDVFGLGLEISQVKISSDFTCLMVYWFTKGTDTDDLLAGLLEKVSFALRHQLSQLRVIGYVPPIKFLKDDQYSKLVEVDKLMQVADYGEDFVPTDIGRQLKAPPPTISSSLLSHEIRDKIEELEGGIISISGDVSEQPVLSEEDTENDSDIESYTWDANVMRQDILGLNHMRMMKQVTEALVRMRFKRNPDNHPAPTEIAPFEQEPCESGEEAIKQVKKQKLRTIEFLEFLKTRRIERAKTIQRLSTESKEREFYEAELEERTLNAQAQALAREAANFPFKDYNDEDYLDDQDHEELRDEDLSSSRPT